MLKFRLAIVSLIGCSMLAVLGLALGLGQNGVGMLLGNFVPYTVVLVGAIIFTLALPAGRQLNWLKIATLSVLCYFVMVVGLQYIQSVSQVPFPSIIVPANMLFVNVALACWVSDCIASFENNVYRLGLNESMPSIQDPESEERVQEMLMNSRYTGQALGFIAIDVCPQDKERLKSRLVDRFFERVAEEHWQTEISRDLRKELRLIDKFYKIGSGSRLLLMCPGLEPSELAELSAKLEHSITDKTKSNSACHYVSFPNEALTLAGLITRLDEKSGIPAENLTAACIKHKAEKIRDKMLATPSRFENRRE